MRHALALVIIDVLVDFFERVPELSSQRAHLVSATNHLSGAFRSAGQPVIWVRQEFQPDLSDAFLDMRRRGISITIAGTEGAAILPDLTRASTDHVIVKKRYSAFFGTELDALLATLGVREIVLAGVNTHACVRTTAIDAYQRDFDVTLASECVGSYDDEHHNVTMKYLDGKIARLSSSGEIIERLRARPVDAR
jgi:nicotinamidase-related amidase